MIARRSARSLRCISTHAVARADTTSKDAVSRLLSDLDSMTLKKPSKPRESAPKTSEDETTSSSSSSSSSSGSATLSPQSRPNSRALRSDTGSVFFRDTDAERYKISENKYHLHCLTSHSNTLLTLTNHKHEPIMWTSAGLCGFKKSARGGYEAGFRSITSMLEKMKVKEEDDAALELKARTDPARVQKVQAKRQKAPFRPSAIEVIIKDFGQGRDAIQKALMGVEGDYYRNRITKIIDATPLKFGGVRPRATRRL